MAHYVEEHRRGAFAMGAPNDDVAQATGRPAESFEAVARRHAALPANRRSAANTRRELARALLLPLAPGPDTERYLRGLQIAAPRTPEYVAESATWRREHGFAPATATATAAAPAPQPPTPALRVP
jgi:hypothetical protein